MEPEWESSPLQGHEHADVLIAGADLTGLMLGALLCRNGLKVILLETDEGCTNSSCSGLASLMAPLMLQRILHFHGTVKAKGYLQSLRRLTLELPHRLPHGLALRTSHIHYAMHAPSLPLLMRQHRICQQLGLPVVRPENPHAGPLPCAGSLLLTGQLLVDVSAFTAQLRRSITANGGRICRHAAITELHTGRICTAAGCADGDVLVLSSGLLPLMPRSPLLPLLESRTLALLPIHGGIPLTAVLTPAAIDGLTLYPSGSSMLAVGDLGASGLPGQDTRLRHLRRMLRTHLPDCRSGPILIQQEVRSRDGLPLVGEIPGSGGRLLCAAGCGGMGILGACIAARALHRTILGKLAPEDALLQPGRPCPAMLRQQHAAACLRSRLHVRAPRCTCRRGRLHYSLAAGAWQCSACGSVFGYVGQRIAGPSLSSADVLPSQRPL